MTANNNERIESWLLTKLFIDRYISTYLPLCDDVSWTKYMVESRSLARWGVKQFSNILDEKLPWTEDEYTSCYNEFLSDIDWLISYDPYSDLSKSLEYAKGAVHNLWTYLGFGG